KSGGLSFLSKILLLIFVVFCAVGIVFSYSRAAFLSLIFVSGFYLILKLRIRFQTLMISLLLVLAFGFTFSSQIYQQVKFNRSVSGKNFATDIRSISNVRTDESNVERINRWESGYR